MARSVQGVPLPDNYVALGSLRDPGQGGLSLSRIWAGLQSCQVPRVLTRVGVVLVLLSGIGS